MVLSMWRTKRVLILSVVVSMSGLLMGTAQASDPAHLDQLTKTRSCAGCDLSGANLAGWTLPKANLAGANLTGASLYKAQLSQAKFDGAVLVDADLTGANLLGAQNANLSGAKTDARTTCPSGKAGPCQ